MNDNYEMEFLLEDLKSYCISYLSRIKKARLLFEEGDTYGAYRVAWDALCWIGKTAWKARGALNKALGPEEEEKD